MPQPQTPSHPLRRALRASGGLAAWLVLVLIAGAARLLAPFRLGRLLEAVSVPRLREHRLRTSLTVVGIGLGVAVLVAVLIVNDSVVRGVAATVDDIAGKTDLQVSSGSSGFSETLLAAVRAVPGVAKAAPITQQNVRIRDPQAHDERLLVLGVDMLENDDVTFRSYGSSELEAIRRDPMAFLNSAQNILISQALGRRFGYKLHDKILLATGTGVLPFEIWGFLDDAGVGRAFGGSVAVMYYQAMQVAFDRERNIDRIDLALSPGQKLSEVEARLRQKLGDGFIIERPQQKGERIGSMLVGVRSGLMIASLIALLVGAFLIHNTMAISVVQRKREIGILRALGSTQREIIVLLTLEGALLGLVGSVLGVLFGILLSRSLLSATSRALNATYVQLAATQVRIETWVLCAGVALGTAAAIVASAVPARQAAKQRTAETLRTGAVMLTGQGAAGGYLPDIGALLLLLAAVPMLQVPAYERLPLGAFGAAFSLLLAAALLGRRLIQLVTWLLQPIADRWLGIEARLANQNLPRDLARASTTAGALMSGVSLAVAFATFTHSFSVTLEEWVDQTLPADLFITQSATVGGTSLRNTPMADTMYEGLRALPQVETVRRIRITEVPYHGLNIKLLSTEIAVLLEHAKISILEGDYAQIVAGLQRGDVTISENFARHFGTHVGDSVTLSTHEHPQTFKVVGVLTDYTSDIGSIWFDRSHFVRIFQDDRVDTYELHLHDHSRAHEVQRLINERFGKDRDLFVLTNAEFRAEIRNTTEQVFSLVRALELVALIVAVLGIVNAQLANVMDRVREIGILRALGMRRRQVSRMVVLEALLTGVVGTLAGVLTGLALGYVLLNYINLVQSGWYFPYRLALTSMIEVACLTLPAAALAGFYPAREASRLVVTEALEYE